jgi:AcrR family transcriptional regulator
MSHSQVLSRAREVRPVNQEAAITLNRADSTPIPRRERKSKPNRRAQILRAASTQFAMTGLHGTTTFALAHAAEISEAIIYVHFGSKTQLFSEAVESNSDIRINLLKSRLASIAAENLVNCIERMAEATIVNCVADTANMTLMNWALLETPEFAVTLYRNEVRSVRRAWDREVIRRFQATREKTRVSGHVISYAVSACLAYGHWLTSLRYAADGAKSLARHFAIGIGQSASRAMKHL